jgi:hypothetical protein
LFETFFAVLQDRCLQVRLRQQRHLRGEAAGRREADGIYQILAGVRKALWHQDLGLELQPLSLIREEPLLSSQEFSVYAAHYGTALVQDL